jgi:hypothetical protein
VKIYVVLMSSIIFWTNLSKIKKIEPPNIHYISQNLLGFKLNAVKFILKP